MYHLFFIKIPPDPVGLRSEQVDEPLINTVLSNVEREPEHVNGANICTSRDPVANMRIENGTVTSNSSE